MEKRVLWPSASQGFWDLALVSSIDTLAQIILWGNWPVLCGMVSSLPGLCPLEVNTPSPQLWQSKIPPEMTKAPQKGGGTEPPQLRFACVSVTSMLLRSESPESSHFHGQLIKRWSDSRASNLQMIIHLQEEICLGGMSISETKLFFF